MSRMEASWKVGLWASSKLKGKGHVTLVKGAALTLSCMAEKGMALVCGEAIGRVGW